MSYIHLTKPERARFIELQRMGVRSYSAIKWLEAYPEHSTVAENARVLLANLSPEDRAILEKFKGFKE